MAQPIAAWLRIRGSEAGPLLCPVTPRAARVIVRRLTAQALYYALRKRGEQANVAPFSPHDLRRTFVTSLLDEGVDLISVQRLAGHVRLDTTARYDRRSEGAKRSAAALLEVPFGGVEGRLIGGPGATRTTGAAVEDRVARLEDLLEALGERFGQVEQALRDLAPNPPACRYCQERFSGGTLELHERDCREARERLLPVGARRGGLGSP